MSDPSRKRIILAITGASGAILGIRALEMLHELGFETHLIVTNAARMTIKEETDRMLEDLVALSSAFYDPDDLGTPIASGSFRTEGMLIVPCSIKTLSAVANSYTADLTARAADVCLKEGRPLLLAVREAPLHPGHIRLMEQAAQAGAILYPPIPFFYDRPQSMQGMIDSLLGRMLQRAGIDNDYYPHWEGRRR
jgi:4-hydroxy-3-polyprenylbenzoate decarboxylase